MLQRKIGARKIWHRNIIDSRDHPCYVWIMEQERLALLMIELIEHIRRPEYLYGSRRWNRCSWIRGDLELESSGSRSTWEHHSVTHPQFIIEYWGPRLYESDHSWWKRQMLAEDSTLQFEGDAQALDREIMWLRLTA